MRNLNDDIAQATCEFRLGRAEGPASAEAEPIEPITVEVLVNCLRELAKSVQRHTKHGGRQSYLTFIDGFLP